MRICWSFALHRLLPALSAAALISVLPAAAPADGTAPPFVLTSTTFAPGATLPAFTASNGCADDAENRSPALAWSGAPAGTKSFALSIYDTDAPGGHGFWHWLMFDIPATTAHLAEGAGNPGTPAAVAGAVMGRNDFGTSSYGGPCPPGRDAPHHYIFTLYALDVAQLPGASTETMGPEVEDLLKGHVLAKATVVGRFWR
jgi:hypothetical protein